MPSLPISEADIRDHTAGGSYERGEQYFENGAVQFLTFTDERTLEARVQGGDIHPYLVEVHLTSDRVASVECTCPYHGGSWCKHAVAALLAGLRAGEVSRESSRVDDLTEPLSRDDLVELLKRLVERSPGLVDTIEEERDQLVGDTSS